VVNAGTTSAFETMLGVDQARERIRAIAATRVTANENVALLDSFGRILAEDVVAPFDVPGYVNSAMDGFAVRAADFSPDGETTLRLAGEIFAGGDEIPRVEPGTCVRITTGAPLARGADTVVMKENTRLDGDRVVIAPGTAPGANVRPAGEDYANGDPALARGDVLTSARVAVLASFGFTRVSVAAKPGAVLFTTGDELTEPGKPLGFGKIYDSNRFSAGGLIEQHGGRVIRHERLRDDPASLADALVRAGHDADFIVSSGGVSAGEADYLPRILADVGKVYFWKVKIKPGMPFLFGQVGKALMFALPGNPVSGIATFLTLVAPALAVMQGRADTSLRLCARLTDVISKRHPRAEFQRARITCDPTGQLLATPLRKQGSGMLRGAADADALIVLPEGVRDFAAGDVVSFLSLPGWASGV
jgi:molybdopterin molybdotransferase